MATPPNPTDYSPSSTLIHFARPLPLLRVPISAGPPDDPFVLAFKDPQSWASAYKACESQITQQCEAGSRIGCSISASSNCRPPWWKTLIGVSKTDFAEREKCEEREMAICVEAAKANCRKFAKDKCLLAFRDARIAYRKVNWREASKLIYWASLPDKSVGFELLGLERSWFEFKCRIEVTNCRGNDLLGSYLSIEDCVSSIK